MDFHGMKRKDLQTLCKKHKIPANLSNHEMANRLTELLKNENGPVAECEEQNASAIEKIDVVVNKEVKKVRFSPEHELIEFSRSINLKRRSKRNSACITSSPLSKETVSGGEMNSELVGRQGRATRSRGQKPMNDKENEKKRGRNGVKCDSKDDEVLVEILDNPQLGERDINGSRRVTRPRGKVVVEGGKTEIKRGRKREKNDDESDQKALCNGDDDKLTEKVVDNPCQVTRSRGQKVMEDATKKDKGGKVVENNENGYPISTENDNGKGVVSRNAKRVRSNGRVEEELLKNQKIAAVDVMIEPPKMLRRSMRNADADKLGDSAKVNDTSKKNKSGGFKGGKETLQLLAADGPGLDVGDARDNIDQDRSLLVQMEEPIHLKRRINRRKTDEVENAEQQMENPAVQNKIRRSTRNASKHKSSETVCEPGGDDIIQPKDEARKLKKSIALEDVIVNTVQNKQLTRKECVSKKAVTSTAAAVEVAYAKKSPSVLEQTHGLDTVPLQESFQETDHLSYVDVQLPMPEDAKSTEDPGLISSASDKNMSNDVQLASSGKGLSKKKDVVVANGAGSANHGMRVINIDEAEMVLSMLNSDVLKSTEFCIAKKDVPEPEPQVVGQPEDISCNMITNIEAVPEGSDIPGSVSSPENRSLVDKILKSDQADFKTDFEETWHEEEPAEHRLAVLDDVHDVHGVSILENAESEEHVNMRSSSVDCQQDEVDNLGSSINCHESSNNDTFLKSGETLVFESSDKNNGSINSKSAYQLNESTASKPSIIQEDGNTAEENGTDGGGFLKDCEGASIKDNNALCVSDLFEAENSITNFEEKGMQDDLLPVSVIAICANSIEVTIDRHSEDGIGKSCESESAEICIGKSDEGKSVQDHNQKSYCSDEDGEYLSNLFDSKRRASITSQDGGTFSAAYLRKGYEHGVSSLQEIIPSKSEVVSEYQDIGASVDGMEQGGSNAICQSIIAGEEMLTTKTIVQGGCEIENQADELCNEDTYESGEHRNIPLLNPFPDPVQEHKTCSAVDNEPTMSIFTANSGKSRQCPVQVSNTDSNAYDENLGMEMENPIDACATDVTISMSPTTWGHKKIEEGEDLLTNHTLLDAGEETSNTEYSQSWTEIDLNNLFGKFEDDVTSTELNHTPLGTEMGRTLSLKKSYVSRRDKLTGKDKGMEREQESESVKTTSAGCHSVGMEDQLKLLFATPFNANETSVNDRKLDGTAMSLNEGPETMIENLVTRMKFDEAMGDTTHEYEYNLYLENPTEYESAKVPSEVECKVGASEGHLIKNACESGEVRELKEADYLELVNTCIVEVPSEAEYEVCEASKSQSSMKVHKFEEDNAYTAKVPSEAEYGIYELSGEQLTENTCTTKVSEANEYEVCEAENAGDYREIILTTEGQSEVEYNNNALEVSAEQLAVNTCDCSEEIIITPEDSSQVEYNAHDVSAQQLAENPCSRRKEVFFTTDSPAEVELGREVSEYQQAKNASECREALLCGVENTDLVNDCASEVPQEASKEQLTENGSAELVNTYSAQVPSVECTKEQFVNTGEFKEETETNKLLNGESVDINISEVAAPRVTTSYVCQAPEKQLAEKAFECQEGSWLNGMEDADVLNAIATEVLLEAECNAREASVEQLAEETCEGRRATHSIVEILEEKHLDEIMDEKDSTDKGTLSSTYSSADDNKKVIDTIAKLSKEDGDNENGSLPKPEQATNFFNITADQDTSIEETIAQFNIPKLQLKAGSEELNNNIPFITNVSASGCNDVLQDIDLADTIKEYINTESSLAANLHDSDGPTLPKNLLPSGFGSVTVPKSPACIINPIEEGSAVNAKRRIFSTAKKNARTILIHGTPRKAVRGVEMKENEPSRKGSNMGDATTVRPKRRALQDVKWKY